ncbi:T9SS type A sorting domain-containing protein [Pseudoflavitalea rhizosphaerae]|uniref:T9SS type A sorting domain-containing protein n=1 Tax=Pseudoflavitalea rhizosphaerae TaxID=1884793 RepID=UPI000F8E96B1|nr:T9SS type A sorting domain-containing protein [Pseudoflavitalea rhizosphaerae]
MIKKKIAGLVLAAGILCASATAQPPYPTALDRGNIVYLEYFIDNDPGPGNGTAVPVSPGRDIASISIDADISGISKAWHRLYIRARNADGGWSLCSFALFDNVAIPSYPTATAVVNLEEMEYYIDSDPGMGNGIKVPLPASPGQNNITIPVDISNLAGGIHRLVIRSRNSLNQWSLTNISTFENTALRPYPEAGTAGPVTQMEYFFDTDPGFGNGQPISFTGAPDINQLSVNADITGLTEGQHTLYLRSREFPWSLTMAVNFNYGTSLPVTWLYVRGERKQQSAIINWATAQEFDSDNFVVEYSRDGREYTSIGEVKAAGNSSTSRKYEFTWHGLQPGVNYFRLKQIDKNGTFSYSSIISIPFADRNTAPVLLPNPVDKTATLLVPPSFEATHLNVFDAAGRIVWQQAITSNNNSYQLLQLGSLQKGIYVLQVKGKAEHHTIRFVKK